MEELSDVAKSTQAVVSITLLCSTGINKVPIIM